MSRWVTVGAVSDFPPGQPRAVQAEERELVVYNVDGQLYATINECPHAGAPLDSGYFRKNVITCPYHHYAFDVCTGLNVDFPDQERPLKTFPVRVMDGQVQIELPPRNVTPGEPDATASSSSA